MTKNIEITRHGKNGATTWIYEAETQDLLIDGKRFLKEDIQKEATRLKNVNRLCKPIALQEVFEPNRIVTTRGIYLHALNISNKLKELILSEEYTLNVVNDQALFVASYVEVDSLIFAAKLDKELKKELDYLIEQLKNQNITQIFLNKI